MIIHGRVGITRPHAIYMVRFGPRIQLYDSEANALSVMYNQWRESLACLHVLVIKSLTW